jgi:hypothetical protein
MILFFHVLVKVTALGYVSHTLSSRKMVREVLH